MFYKFRISSFDGRLCFMAYESHCVRIESLWSFTVWTLNALPSSQWMSWMWLCAWHTTGWTPAWCESNRHDLRLIRSPHTRGALNLSSQFSRNQNVEETEVTRKSLPVMRSLSSSFHLDSKNLLVKRPRTNSFIWNYGGDSWRIVFRRRYSGTILDNLSRDWSHYRL